MEQMLDSAVVVRPPSKQRRKFPYQGEIRVPGLPLILVENVRGSIRQGRDAEGNVTWQTVMPAHYGEFDGTVGADGDPLDVFVGEDLFSPYVYVVHTRDPRTRKYDEDKVFVGFPSSDHVRFVFGLAYDRRGMRHGTVRRLTVPAFLAWLGAHGARGVKLEVGRELAKASPGMGSQGSITQMSHTYVSRVPTGNPNHPWRYIYPKDHKPGGGQDQDLGERADKKSRAASASQAKHQAASMETTNSHVGRALNAAGFTLRDKKGGVEVRGFGGASLAVVPKDAMHDRHKVSQVVSHVARANVTAIRRSRAMSRHEARHSLVPDK